jgi:hypothetical protein
MEDVVDAIDQPRIKRVKHSGIHLNDPSTLTTTDASIQKRSPLQGATSPTRRKASGRPDEDAGLCIYLNRHSSLPNTAERIEKALQDGKNSKFNILLKSTFTDYIGMELLSEQWEPQLRELCALLWSYRNEVTRLE